MPNLPARRSSTGLDPLEEVAEGEIVDEEHPSNPHQARLLRQLEDRRAASMDAGQIDNASLYAGSPMYYYCKFCGVPTETKPEGWFIHPPITTCQGCSVLIELGWHDGHVPRFPRRTPPGAPGPIPNLLDLP